MIDIAASLLVSWLVYVILVWTGRALCIHDWHHCTTRRGYQFWKCSNCGKWKPRHY